MITITVCDPPLELTFHTSSNSKAQLVGIVLSLTVYVVEVHDVVEVAVAVPPTVVEVEVRQRARTHP